MNSTEALSCTCSNWLARNWSAQSWWDEVYLHGTAFGTYRPKKLHFTLLSKPHSPTGQDQHRTWDGEKRWVIAWSTKSEGGSIGVVKPACMVFSDNQSILISLCWNITWPDVLSTVHTQDSAFTTSRILSYMLFFFCHNDNDVTVRSWSLLCLQMAPCLHNYITITTFQQFLEHSDKQFRECCDNIPGKQFQNVPRNDLQNVHIIAYSRSKNHKHVRRIAEPRSKRILKWGYLMIFMRVLVAVSVRWCKV